MPVVKISCIFFVRHIIFPNTLGATKIVFDTAIFNADFSTPVGIEKGLKEDNLGIFCKMFLFRLFLK